MLPRGNNKEVMTAITLCPLLYIDNLIKKKKNFLFLSIFRFTEKLQRWYIVPIYSLFSFPYVNILHKHSAYLKTKNLTIPYY